MQANLHIKMMQMVEKAGREGLSSNVPFKPEQFNELVKLRQLSILQASYEKHATEVNLPIVSREHFTQSLVNIAYSYAGIDKHRHKRHSLEFFRDNIAVYDGNHLHFNPQHVNAETMLYAFSKDRVYQERFYKLDGMDTFAIFRDVKKRHQEKTAINMQHKLFQNDLMQLGLANQPQMNLLNPEIMELMRMQQHLLEQALEQQKLTLLQANPELLKSLSSKNFEDEDTSVRLAIEQKLNERIRS